MNTYHALESHWHRYHGAQSEYEGIKITCHLKDQVIFYDDIHFDNLIASQVVEEARSYQIWEWEKTAREIPCPLKVLWRNKYELPYYAASSMIPEGEVVWDTHYFHKRAPTGRFSAGNKRTGKLKIDGMRGRWMERRIPFRSVLTDRLIVYCVGDPNEIKKYLSRITHVGKKRSAGFGEVTRWDMEPCDIKPTDCIVSNRQLIKPLPEGAARALDIHVNSAQYMIGWTPPQWNPAGFEPGWAVHSEVTL